MYLSEDSPKWFHKFLNNYFSCLVFHFFVSGIGFFSDDNVRYTFCLKLNKLTVDIKLCNYNEQYVYNQILLYLSALRVAGRCLNYPHYLMKPAMKPYIIKRSGCKYAKVSIFIQQLVQNIFLKNILKILFIFT